MEESTLMKNMMGAVEGERGNMLGKLLYFSLPSVLVERDKLQKLCDDMGIYFAGGNRLPVADAFRSATGDIRERIVSKQTGERKIYQIYCRDNQRVRSGIMSRELVKETLNQKTNQYEKMANISFDKNSHLFSYENLVYDCEVDAAKYCRRAEELFELYQTCANRRQIETICLNFIRSLEATKLSVNGHIFFIPRHNMERVDIFEDFIAEVGKLSKNGVSIMANSIYIVDDAKQREKMTEEFYSAVKKEIAEYQERADYFIQSGCQSPAVMERWAMRIRALEEKKQHYEDVLRRELNGLDDEFETLKLLSQELQIRANGIRLQKAS